ncbi:MAG: YkvA family protein [Chloroflexota bacterium]
MPKEKRPMTYDPNVNMIRNFIIQVRLTWKLLRDVRVPLWVKGTFLASVAYIVMPLDIVPDAIPLLGQIDDLGVLAIGMKLLMDMSPADAVAEHMESITGHTAWEITEEEKKANAESAKATTKKDGTIIEGTFTESETKNEQ